MVCGEKFLQFPAVLPPHFMLLNLQIAVDTLEDTVITRSVLFCCMDARNGIWTSRPKHWQMMK